MSVRVAYLTSHVQARLGEFGGAAGGARARLEVCALRQAARRGLLYELDHKTALGNGGSNELSNAQALCSPCHGLKTHRELINNVPLKAPATSDGLRTQRSQTIRDDALVQSESFSGNQSPFKAKRWCRTVRFVA